MEATDEQILDIYHSTSREKAFNLIVKNYQEPIYWHIRRIVIDHDDADDVVQNTFLKVWKNFDRFKGDSKIYTWLYRIATNESLNFIQKNKKNLNVSLDNSVMQIEGSGHGFSGDEIQLKLQKALLALPDKQRLVFNMKYFEDKKYDEISEILGTSVGALKASYHHAVKKIKAFLEAY